MSVTDLYTTGDQQPADSPGGLQHLWLAIIPASFVLLILLSATLRRKLTWRVTPDALGIALLTIADASSFWSANNPSGFTVRSFSTAGGNKHDQAVTDIQLGGVKAVVESALIGVGGSLLTGSYLPWFAQAAYLVGDWFWFDWMLKNPHAGSAGIAGQG